MNRRLARASKGNPPPVERIVISVIGDVILDRYWICSNHRKPNPESIGGIAYSPQEKLVLGGAASVARLIKWIGGDVLLWGSVGDDEAGESLGELCRSCDFVAVLWKNATRTTVKTRIISDGDIQDDRYDFDGVGGCIKVSGIGESSVVVVQDYGKGSVSELQMRLILDESPATVIVDPAIGKDPMKYAGADIIKANAKEAAMWLPFVDVSEFDDPTIAQVAQEVAVMLGADVIVTEGEKGLTIYSPDRRGAIVIPAVHAEAVDVCGAGDMVAAALAVKIAAGDNIVSACEFAVAQAAQIVQVVGCDPSNGVLR